MSKVVMECITKFENVLEEGKMYNKSEILELFKTSNKKKEKVKRARSAYQCFMGDSEIRNAVMKQHPNTKPNEMLKLLAIQWNAFTQDDRQVYNDQSNKERKLIPHNIKSKERKAKTPYQFYMSDSEVRAQIKQENPTATNKEMFSLISIKWKVCQDKQKYISLSELDKSSLNIKVPIRTEA